MFDLYKNVTAEIVTRNRYFTTLPTLLTAIINQSVPPGRILIMDDGDHLDLTTLPIYQCIFAICRNKGIKVDVMVSNNLGLPLNRKRALENTDSEFVWRLDDDCVPEAHVLETLVANIRWGDNIGAVSSLVFVPGVNYEVRPMRCCNKIEDIFVFPNTQWYKDAINCTSDVEHFHCAYLFRRELHPSVSKDYLRISKIGNREDSIFTHEIMRSGYTLVVNNEVITWHMRISGGGSRDIPNYKELYEQDDKTFKEILDGWNIDYLE